MSLFDNIPEGTDIIEVRKKVNKMLSEARKKAKPPKCILCGKEQSSFCNSHSVPQMCLRPIADRGKVLHASLAMGFDIGVVDLDGGVNKSGTFNYICRECDAKFFQDYENPDNIIQPPTDKILAEIAVKNMLLQLNKRANEQELIQVVQREFRISCCLGYVSEVRKCNATVLSGTGLASAWSGYTRIKVYL